MRRKAELYLLKWHGRNNRKPLIINGARQVGKTYLIESWGKQHFQSLLKVDLERERDLHGLFALTDPKRFLAEFAVLKQQPIVAGQTLLFLDEIQACPSALAMLRYFYELAPDLHVIAASSLLDFALRDFAHSMPVGRIEFMHLHPLSFEEFLEAIEGRALAEYVSGISLKQPLSDTMDKKLLETLRKYYFIGGMPEAVRVYSERHDLLEVQRVQTGLVQTVQDDFAKYGSRRMQDLMRKTYQHVAANVGRKVKFVNISREDRALDLRRALELLTQSRVVHLIYHTAANGLPLGAERDDRHFKPIFLDIGLVNRMCGLNLIGTDELIAVNEGALAQQFIGQQLLCAALPFEDPQLFYWSREARNSNAELDFVISRHQDILPIEVKAGKTGTLRSLMQFLQEKNRSRAVRFHLRPPALEEIKLAGEGNKSARLLSLPLYLAGQLDRLLSEAFELPSQGFETDNG